jgi:hypothetical protein
MSPSTKPTQHSNKSSYFNEIFLKVGVVFFIFGITFNLFSSSNEINDFETFIKILSIILFFVLSLFTIAMPKKFFKSFVFFLVFIASFFKIIVHLSERNINIEIVSVYFLIITMSLFLLPKSSSHSHRS